MREDFIEKVKKILPERASKVEWAQEIRRSQDYEEGLVQGWNNCLDKILHTLEPN